MDITPQPLPFLINIAESEQQDFLRRQRAIWLLATFKTPTAAQALGRIAIEAEPVFRCMALHSITELDSTFAIEVMVSKLDDQSPCMQSVSSHGSTEDIYVSDEAVRLLEKLTGLSFEDPVETIHRTTEPWKEWWNNSAINSAMPTHQR